MNPLPIEIGFRYTRASRKSGLLSFLSSVSMAGLIVGISLLVLVLSVMNGFERELRERILGLLPQASLYQAGGMADWETLATELSTREGVSGAAPFVQIHALLAYRQRTEAALIYGIDVQAEQRISRIAEYASQEALAALEAEPGSILMGVDLAEKLGITPGSQIMVVAPGTRAGSAAQIHYLRLAGYVDSGSELDQSLVLAALDSLNALRPAQLHGKVDGLRLQFDALDEAPWRAMHIANELGPIFYQNNWQRTHGNLYHAIRMSKAMVGLLMSLIVALAAFNVVSTLILVVTEKQGSIAILRTLGASSGAIMLIFVTQGLVIGAGGVALGLALGCALVWVIEPAVQLLEALLGVQFLHSDVYPLTSIPAEMRLEDVISVVGVAMVLVFIATLYPAWRATRLQPADVLRYE